MCTITGHLSFCTYYGDIATSIYLLASNNDSFKINDLVIIILDMITSPWLYTGI